MCNDGMGGAFISWHDHNEGDEFEDEIYAQRFHANGTIMWGVNGTVIRKVNYNQVCPSICSNGAGGAIVKWSEKGAESYAQRIDIDGKFLWDSNGTMICKGYSMEYRTIADGENGMIFFYYGYNSYFYGQKLDSNGNKLWGVNGTKIVADNIDPFSIQDMKICSDGEGGALFTWIYRKDWTIMGSLNYDSDIYVHKINYMGNAK